MKVTAQQGRGKKIHILIDGEYRFTVSSDFWSTQGVRSGDELTDEEFAELYRAASSGRAFNSAVDILSRRDHSAKELERKIMRHADRETAHEAVQRLEELGYVNDERYAENLSKELYERKGMAPRRIEQELRRRGVDGDIASQYSQELSGDEPERIYELLSTKFYGRFGDEKGRRRTFAALTRMGYSYSDIRSAMRRADEENGCDGDEYFDE